MKYIACLLAVCMMSCMVFTGCKTNSDNNDDVTDEVAEKVADSFTSEATISYKDIVATATINKEKRRNYDIKFSAPESLKNMCFGVHDDMINIEYKDISLEMTTEKFFDSSIVKMLVNSLDKVASKNGLNIKMTKTCITVSGNTSQGEFSLSLDKDSGDMLSLDIPSSDLNIKFDNFNFI